MKIINKDIVIIGSGLSGLYTSLHIDKNLKIGIVSKDKVTRSNSTLAQGGIATCVSMDDSFESHKEDTLRAGSNINKIDAVELLVKEAPAEIHRLIELGVEFDKNDQGMVMTTMEGGHSKRRILHANGDATGKVIMESVTEQVLERDNIEIFEKTMAIEIIKDQDDNIQGLIALNLDEYVFIQAGIIVIASGGVGALFKDTTNQSFSTGDGISLGMDIGCQLTDMCFVQFHPTAFYEKEDSQRFLISEAVRGEGGILKNDQGYAFMKDYDSRKDLAPRDIVSQSIYHQMLKDKTDHVWLDIRHQDQEFLSKRFPTIYNYLANNDVAMDKDLIAVKPVAHYFVGGLTADLNGCTNIKGVYACGEVSSTGVHGANRLASNSLLECLVFGKRCALHINKTFREPSNIFTETNLDELKKYRLEELNKCMQDCMEKDYDQCDYSLMKKDIQGIMSTYVGIVRTDSGLKKGKLLLEKIKEVLVRHEGICSSYYEILAMVKVGIAIIDDAIAKDSIGCHYKIQDKEDKVVS